MNDIKFRFFDTRKGCYVKNMVGGKAYAVSNDGVVMLDTGNGTWIDTNLEAEQFTGLKDRDGNDIYEGDILEFDRKEWGGDDNIHGPVVYCPEDGEWITGGGSNRESQDWKKIIGNIRESPELIQSI